MDFTKPLVHGSFMFYFVIFAFPISHLSNKKKKKIPAQLLAYILVAPLFLYLAGLGSRFCAISSQS